MIELEIKRRDGAWEIVGDPDAGAMGPYNHKTDAETDKRGVDRFYRNENRPSFFTGEKER